MLKAKRNWIARTSIEGLESRVLFAVFTVTDVGDTGPGTLRQAILDANTATGQQDTIEFAIPGGGVQTISPVTNLPTLTDPAGTLIDGSTQPGFATGVPTVVIDGSAITTNGIGFQISGGGSTITGLGIQDFTQYQVLTTGTGGNQIAGNVITGVAGSTGIRMEAPGTVGGLAPAQNVIGGNTGTGTGVGIGIHVLSDGVTIENNFIGTNVAGTAAAANRIGISVTGPSAIDNVLITENIVSGNLEDGIVAATGTGTLTLANNRIGTNAAGTAALGNGDAGLQLSASVISLTGNTISGNAVGITGTATGSIQGNQIGTDTNGSADLGNTGDGMTFTGSMPNLVDNVISGNGDDGVSVSSLTGTGLIQNNRIGTNNGGIAALANGGHGIVGQNITGVLTIEDNVLSGNAETGITLDAGGAAVIQGNQIGADTGGAADLGNTSHGISITGTTTSATVQDNVISGNGGAGVDIGGGANTITVVNNRIGTDAAGTADLGNDGPGVAIRPGTVGTPEDNVIGGTTTNTGNVIAFNGGAGVAISGSSVGNQVIGNSIFSNTGIGIDLVAGSTTGRTPNDANDADTGANDFQNFPVITGIASASGTTTINGVLNSNANTAYRIEFFTDLGTDAAAAEGRTLIGFADVTTNGSGQATINASVQGNLPIGRLVTATATSAAGNTSEFSDPVAAGTSGPDIEVRGNNAVITTGDATPSAADFTDFGATVIGTPIDRVFTIANTGQAVLQLTSGGTQVTLSGPGASQFEVIDQPGATVGIGQSTTITIRFTPTSAGNQSATVSIASNDSDETPFTFAIIGQGTSAALLPEIEVSGGGVPIASGDTDPITADLTNFGTGIIGTGVTRTFTITNAGQEALAISGVSLSGAGAAQYAIVTQPATSVAAGQSTTFSVRFNPTAGGQFNATVSIANNDATENPYSFAITGIGMAGEGQPPAGMLVIPAPDPVDGSTTYDFIVRYTDDRGFSSSTFDNNDIVVTGPNGFSQAATFVLSNGSATQFDVRYRINAPGGILDATDNGTYTATLQTGEIIDTDGNAAAAGSLGTFDIDLETRTSAGQVGVVNGRKTKLTFTETDNTVVTITLNGGTGEVFKTSNGRFDLELTASKGKVSITTRGGNGRAEIDDIRITGGLKSLVAKTGDVTGVVISTGDLSSINLGSTSGATISSPAPIKSLNIAGVMSNTQVWSGAILGADARFGGIDNDADTYGQGEIRKITVGGAVATSLFAAGFNPTDDVLLNGNGTIVGGAVSRINSINIKSTVDQTTRFTAGTFPKRAKIGGQSIVPTSDARFDTTA